MREGARLSVTSRHRAALRTHSLCKAPPQCIYRHYMMVAFTLRHAVRRCIQPELHTVPHNCLCVMLTYSRTFWTRPWPICCDCRLIYEKDALPAFWPRFWLSDDDTCCCLLLRSSSITAGNTCNGCGTIVRALPHCPSAVLRPFRLSGHVFPSAVLLAEKAEACVFCCSDEVSSKSGAGTAISSMQKHTHGSFPIRRQRGHPGVVLPLVISNSATH